MRVRAFTASSFALCPLFLSVALACQTDGRAKSSSPIRVAAAADLALAFEELGRVFETATGEKVIFSFGSTGLLAKQIRQGAPFDMFAAANVSFVDDVVSASACDGATKVPYARGRIALWTNQSLKPPTGLADLADARFQRIAIAHPDHAPYGRAAKQAFESLHLWDRIQSRLVFGENVRQTLQFAQTGNVEAAVVALGLVAHDRVNPWTLVDESLHSPIEQVLVICRRGNHAKGGLAFAKFVGSAEGRAVMRRYGFLLPQDLHSQDMLPQEQRSPSP